MKRFDASQKLTPIRNYKTTPSLLVFGLFETFLIDFAGPFKETSSEKRHLFIEVEHLTGWPIAVAAKEPTAKVVLNFVQQEIIDPFGLPKRIISDNSLFSLQLSSDPF